MYGAAIHPEQYSNTLSDDQLKKLHKSLIFVCSTAVETQSDSSRFPDDWLFKHRWGKGKKGDPKILPNGAKIEFVTVGGRTSAVVPSVQKKTGPVAGDVKKEVDDENGDEVASGESADLGKKAKSATKPKSEKKNRASNERENSLKVTPKHLDDPRMTNNPRETKSKQEPTDYSNETGKSPGKKRKGPPKDRTNGDAPKEATAKKVKLVHTNKFNEASHGSRRSARVSGKNV